MRYQELFVPHKDSPIGVTAQPIRGFGGDEAGSSDVSQYVRHEELRDILDQQKTNNLSIQNYVNKQPHSARGRSTAATTVAGAGNVKCPIDLLDYDITGNMVDLTNDRILLPEDGIYLVTASVTIFLPDPGAILINGPINAYIYANGALSVSRQYETWCDNTIYNGPRVLCVSQYRGSVRDYLEIFVPDYSNNGAFGFQQVILSEFVVTMIGKTPSTTQ